MRMIGYVDDRAAPCAIYPLARGGSYEDRLVPTDAGTQRLHTLGFAPPPLPLTWRERLRVLRDATAALVYLHEPVAGVKTWSCLHCDVKASNILLGRDGSTLLSDVGIAKQRELTAAASDSTASTSRTATGMASSHLLRGTPSHLDPLFLQSGKRSKATDGYALGVVMLESLTGRFPRECGFSECKPLLQAPQRPELWASALLDSTAGWPHDVAAALAVLVTGLSWERFKEDRTPCTEALATLQRLASAHGLPDVPPTGRHAAVASSASEAPLGTASPPPGEERSMCIICDERPHTVRFQPCGHAVVCGECEQKARSYFSNKCPTCGSAIDGAERGKHIGEAPTFAFRRG